MKFFQTSETELSPKAQGLVEFDADSIRQVAAGGRRPAPVIWLSDPLQYERDGRILRDSPSPRLLAYSPEDRILYANDGCNTCSHHLSRDIGKLDADALRTFAHESRIPEAMLARLIELAGR